jgi:diguanylate cyclase (GGDEF)-like protein/PAS domain S-box-containing protein
MQSAPPRREEAKALAALQALEVLDTGPEAEFDALVRVASLVCATPISLVSLIDAERQWLKARVGLPDVTETPRDIAFCAHVVHNESLLEVSDAHLDPRFVDNPLTQGEPGIRLRFYAGAPIVLGDGSPVGTLCVIDTVPRHLDDMQREVLNSLALAAARALEGRHAVRALERTRDELANRQQRLQNIVEGTRAVTWEWNIVTGEEFFNERWSELLDRPINERGCLPNLSSFELIHPDDRSRVTTQIERHFAGHSPHHDCELRVRHRDGHYLWLHQRGRVVSRTHDGRPTWFAGTLIDVTERVNERVVLEATRARMALATEVGSVGIWDWDLNTNELIWDKLVYRMFGLSSGDPSDPYTLWFRHVHPDDLHRVEALVRSSIDNLVPFDTDYRIVRPDGLVRVIHESARVVLDAEGRPLRMLGTNIDVTAVRGLEARLTEQHELLRVTLESIGDGVITTDRYGQVMWLNRMAERSTGWKGADAAGRPVEVVFHLAREGSGEACESPIRRCLEELETQFMDGATMLRSRTGAEIAVELSASPMRGAAGAVLGAVLVFNDVTAQRRAAAELSYRASHDALTGLVNRAEFENRLRRAWLQSVESGPTHALLYIDLDQFKLVNDACGHSIGDRLLQEVSKMLMSAVRSSDTVARLGGDEFAILLVGCSFEHAQRVGRQICKRMDDYRFTHDGRGYRVGTSIGLVPVDARWASINPIQQAADSCCYAAKDGGRNRVHVWVESDEGIRSRQGDMQWTSRIEQAIDHDRFTLFAQRIEALGGAVDGIHAEVLLRMVEPDGSLIPPGAFLPAAERFHLASRVDRWVLRQVIDWLKAQTAIDSIASLHVNVSGQSIGDRAFHRWAIEMLTAAGPAICQRLCFEITETAAVMRLADAALFIEQVQAVGVGVALDDFGAGAASLGYLKSMPVNMLKIDGQFIQDLLTDPLDEVAVRCFIDVAKVVGMKTVAEFVETAAVRDRPRELGVDFAQGYLVHRPAPIGELMQLTFSEAPLRVA